MTSLGRASRFLCRQGWIPPAWLGYSDLPRVRPQKYCVGKRGSFRILRPARTEICSLPANIVRRDLLGRNPGRYERSFFDVPEYRLEPRSITVLKDARILRHRDQWGDDFYAILTLDDRFLQVTGTSLQPAHLTLLKSKVPHILLDEVTWVTTHSTRNHFMWLYSHLPRILLAESLGRAEQILLPMRDLLSSVKQSMLSLLGFHQLRFIEPGWDVIQVGELHIPDLDGFDPWVLETMRARFSAHAEAKAQENLYITRRHCHYRKLRNEDEVLNAVSEKRDLKNVALEHLTLDEQIRELANARSVFGVHGAGFANLLFCKTGTHVIEIQDPADPNPHFYALAALLKLKYTLLVGQVREQEEAHFRDISITPEEILHALE